MKIAIFLLISSGVFLMACQKSIQETNTLVTGLGNTKDSTIKVGDTITYEVLTSDTGGWEGIWNRPDSGMVSTALDSITWGSPIYLPSGWRYTFVSPGQPFQAIISASARTFSGDLTVNLYKNGALIKSSTNDAIKGVAKLMVNAGSDSLRGTPANPVLTYEVEISERDTTKFESDAWFGHWINAKGIFNDLNTASFRTFAIPSGWKYSFKPGRLPFTMRIQANPYTSEGGKVTINFFVNGQLVKSFVSRNLTFDDMEYTVQ